MKKKIIRVFALIGAILLAGMYLVVLYLGLTANPNTQNVLMAAIGCTIVIPVLLYAMMLIARVLDNRQNPGEKTEKKERKEGESYNCYFKKGRRPHDQGGWRMDF